ncbi:MAG: hypothetical protein KatS3mg054_0101 [Chloroflexus sp.]|nr:MAG: hypothetical protein KatS3mg054_0101 [Chloroflexus sp.]
MSASSKRSLNLIKAVKEAEIIENLRRTNRRLVTALRKSKLSREEQLRAITSAIYDAVSAITIPPPIKIHQHPDGVKEKHSSQHAIFVLSDWQLGKVTPTYNTKIAMERIRKYIERSLSIVSLHRKISPVSTARVYLVGDIVEGELIFPGQAHALDASLFKQSAIDAPQAISWVIATLAENFNEVVIQCIYGNHGSLGGRARREYHPESNADNLAFQVSKVITEKIPNVKWLWPASVKSWYAIDTIGNIRFLLFHGDQMRGGGFAGIPFYGFARAIHSWASGVIPGGFDYAVCGHWHQGASLQFNFKTLWINGSLESYNVYAQEQLKSMSRPMQWLLFCHPKHGVTAEYKVWLSEDPYGEHDIKKIKGRD